MEARELETSLERAPRARCGVHRVKAFYKHIGDWETATAGLSDAQYTVYDRFVSYYYATEHALPAHADALRDIARATTPERQAAIEPVLARFFTLFEGHYHNQKCDEEITKFRKLIEKRVKAGQAGAMTTNRQRSASAAARDAAHGSAIEAANGRQSSTSREAITTTPLPTSSAGDAAHAESRKGNSDDDIARRVIDYLNQRGGFNYRYAKAHTTLIVQRLRLDHTTEELMRRVIDAKVIEWGRDPEKRGYLSPDTLFNASKYAKYVGQLVGAGVALGLPAAPKQFRLEFTAEDVDGTRKTIVTSFSAPAAGDRKVFPFAMAAKTCLNDYGGRLKAGYFVKKPKNIIVSLHDVQNHEDVEQRIFSIEELSE